MTIESVMPFNHLILCHHLLLLCSILPSLMSQQTYSISLQFSSVQFSHSVMSDSLQPHEPQHAMPPCPSPTPRAYSSSCSLSGWCHPTISYCVVPFSSCPQSFPALGSFQMSQLFASGGQSIGVSPSTSVFPVNTQDWSPLGWTGCIFLLSKGLKGLFQHRSSKASVLQHSAFFIVQLSHPYMTTGKTVDLTRCTFVGKVMSLLLVAKIHRRTIQKRSSQPR